MIQEKEWKEWAKHPVTVEFFHNLRKDKDQLAEMLIEGQFTSESMEATALKHAEVIGMATTLRDILNEYQEEMKDE